MFAFLAVLVAIGLSVIFAVLVSQPLNGAIVRLRANYLPKAVSLDNVLEDGGASSTNPRAISAFLLSERRSTAKIGPVVSGVMAMLLRTKRLEGWSGIYKGSAPVALQLMLFSLLTLIFFSGSDYKNTRGGPYKAAPSGPGQFGFFSNLFYMIFGSLVALPLNVITYRAIVHPRILPLTTPKENLKELLSYIEYSQPWRLYLLPGLLAANFAHIAWIGMVTRLVRHLTVPALGGLPATEPIGPNQDTYSGPSSDMLEFSAFGMTVFVAWNVLSVIVLAPLECVLVRLSTQRPERQNPLHRAYARLPNSSGGGPSPYSHQATAAAQMQPGGVYSDDASSKPIFDSETDATPIDKPLPSSPKDKVTLSRPSFAIEDDDDENETNLKQDDNNQASDESPRPDANSPLDATSTTSKDPQPTPQANSSSAARVLGGISSSTPFPQPQHSSGFSSNNYHHQPPSAHSVLRSGEPPEPVIALRPIEEPRSAEEAAAEFGAPVVQPYQGLVDCLAKMIDEEGLESLSRGAWVTLIGTLAGNFS